MNYDYYTFLVTGILESYPAFQNLCANTCPTIWANGEVCSPQEDCSNKASLEFDLLMALDLI